VSGGANPPKPTGPNPRPNPTYKEELIVLGTSTYRIRVPTPEVMAHWEKGQFTGEEQRLLSDQRLKYTEKVYALFLKGLVSHQCDMEMETQLDPACGVFRYIMADRYYQQVKAKADGKQVLAKKGDAGPAPPKPSGPGASGPSASGPSASGPGASGPGASGPAASGPSASGPEASGPGASGPAPAASGPAPAASGPSASGPGPSGPGASGPAASGPVSSSNAKPTKPAKAVSFKKGTKAKGGKRTRKLRSSSRKATA